MYGFGADSKGHWHHYWENNALAGAFRQTGVHDGDFEFNITLTLASIEKIKFFKGRWPWPQGQVGAAISNMQQNKAQWRWSGCQLGLKVWICGGFGASRCCNADRRELGQGPASMLHLISYLQIAGNYQSVVGIDDMLNHCLGSTTWFLNYWWKTCLLQLGETWAQGLLFVCPFFPWVKQEILEEQWKHLLGFDTH